MELFGFKSFDELLVFHCAPVLAGIKASNLIALKARDGKAADMLLQKYNAEFAGRGIVFRRICSCSRRYLVLVYHEEQLKKILLDKGYRACLVAMGYGAHASAEEDLQFLEQRLQEGAGFPHEIGVFLGYPLEDVLGFVFNGGSGCKYMGYWKVYGDVPAARRIFDAYERCRDSMLQRLAEGMPLQLAAAMA